MRYCRIEKVAVKKHLLFVCFLYLFNHNYCKLHTVYALLTIIKLLLWIYLYKSFFLCLLQIEKRRKGLFPVQPKPPQGFKDYLMNRCTYVLAGTTSTTPNISYPASLQPQMKDLFTDQEKERYRLRMQVNLKICYCLLILVKSFNQLDAETFFMDVDKKKCKRFL